MGDITTPARSDNVAYTVPSSSSTRIVVKITEPNLRAQSLSLETWASSHILASQLHHLTPSINFPPSSSDIVPILELGAGTGLVGIPAAVFWKQPVILTDLEPIVPGLDANIVLNADILERSGTTVEAGTLDWADPSALVVKGQKRTETKVHVLLAADVIYSEEQPEMLEKVIFHWLHRHKDARLIFAWALRVCYLDEIRDMWTRLEEGGLECVQEGQDRASEALFTDECLVEWSVWKWKDM